MRQHHYLLSILAFLGLFASPVLAAPHFDPAAVKDLAGRQVLLLVGAPEATKAQKARYHSLLQRSGADLSKYPVFQTTSLPKEAGARLGLAQRAPGYAALVRWGNPARFGPARVLEPGVVTALSSDADLFVLVEAAVLGAGQGGLLDRLSPELSALRPLPELVIEQVDFQANGRPVYLVDSKVRLRNLGKVAARGVLVIFQVEDPRDGSWFELGRHGNLEIKAGQVITRDLVRTSHETPLLNENKEIQAARYRILVESPHGRLEKTDQFTPALLEDQ